MSTQSPTTDVSKSETENARSRAMDAAGSLSERGRDGSIAMMAGSTLLVRAVRARRNRGRAVVQALAGAALLALGVRQRRTGSVLPSSVTDVIDRGGTGTSEQRAESQQHDANPRGTAGEPDVETRTDPEEGSVQFTEHRNDEPRAEPHLDEPAPEDPRLDEDEEDDEPTEVDLSEASLADEASEATGPTPEQAQPVQTDQIEPDESPPEDAPSEQAADRTDETTDDEDESERARADQDDDEETT